MGSVTGEKAARLSSGGAGIAVMRVSAFSKGSRQGQFVSARSLIRRAVCTSRAGMETSSVRNASVVAYCQPSPATFRL